MYFYFIFCFHLCCISHSSTITISFIALEWIECDMWWMTIPAQHFYISHVWIYFTGVSTKLVHCKYFVTSEKSNSCCHLCCVEEEEKKSSMSEANIVTHFFPPQLQMFWMKIITTRTFRGEAFSLTNFYFMLTVFTQAGVVRSVIPITR